VPYPGFPEQVSGRPSPKTRRAPFATHRAAAWPSRAREALGSQKSGYVVLVTFEEWRLFRLRFAELIIVSMTGSMFATLIIQPVLLRVFLAKKSKALPLP
jgi:hypothetical protein